MADMAVGGQGAPLVPYLDQILLARHYRETKRVGMLLNIGGISNISAYVPPSRPGFCYCDFLSHAHPGEGKERDFVGFDCGPGEPANWAVISRADT